MTDRRSFLKAGLIATAGAFVFPVSMAEQLAATSTAFEPICALAGPRTRRKIDPRKFEYVEFFVPEDGVALLDTWVDRPPYRPGPA